MRWQEVFGGADKQLLKNKKYTRNNSGTSGKFREVDTPIRRKKLFPFIWGEIVEKG